MAVKSSEYPKGSKDMFPWSRILDLHYDSIGFVESAYKAYPDTAYFRMAGLDVYVYLMTHLDYIRDILVRAGRISNMKRV
jgi:hypothetical protein